MDSFYQRFKNGFVPKLCKLFSNCLFSHQVPPSWHCAHIVIIPQKNKDPSLPQSYCPISLLNVDYKILMTVLVSWMNWIIGVYIQTNQSGFMQNRFLKDNIQKVCNIIDFLVGNRPQLYFALLMWKKLSIGSSGCLRSPSYRRCRLVISFYLG